MSRKRFMMVVNPRGGVQRGPAVLEAIRPVFEAAQAELDVHLTTHAGHAGELAQSADLEAYDGLCLIGGDGTIHEVVGGLMRSQNPRRTPLGVIPGGTGNSVLQHFDCLDPVEAAQRVVTGNVQPLDVARVQADNELVYCVNIIGWGAVVDINSTAERLRAIGPPRYAIAAIWQILRANWRPATIGLDGQIVTDSFAFVMACNTKYTGKGMLLAPHAKHDDGKIDVVLVRKAPRQQMLKLFRRVYQGSHLSLDCVEYHQVRSLTISSEGHELLNLDGELKCAAPVAVDIMPAVLRIFV